MYFILKCQISKAINSAQETMFWYVWVTLNYGNYHTYSVQGDFLVMKFYFQAINVNPAQIVTRYILVDDTPIASYINHLDLINRALDSQPNTHYFIADGMTVFFILLFFTLHIKSQPKLSRRFWNEKF